MAGSTGNDNRGQQSPEVSGQWPVCGTDTTRHVAPSSSAWPEGHSGWTEREERPKEALRPCQAPGAEPAPKRILGNEEAKRGERQARGGGWRPEQSRNAEVHAGRSRGGEGQESSPQEQLGGAGRSDAPPLWACRAGPAWARGGAELPSSPCSEPGAARPAGPGPRQPPAAGSSFLAFPGGGG